MSWKEKRLITILSIILAVLCAAVLVVLSIRYRAAQAAKDQNTVSPSDIAEAAQSEYVALSYSNGSTTPVSYTHLDVYKRQVQSRSHLRDRSEALSKHPAPRRNPTGYRPDG